MKAGLPFLFMTATCLCHFVTMEIEYIDHWIEYILSSDWIYFNIGLNTYFNIELNIYFNIELNIYFNIELNIYFNIELNTY